MNADRGENAKVWVVSIHDTTPRGYLAFDVQEILRCLGRSVDDYAWLITDLDCTGPEAQSLCDAVESRHGLGLLLSADELRAASAGFQQTIEAKILAIPKKDCGPGELALLGNLGSFGETDARLAILAIDSSYFEVATKDQRDIESLKQCFKDVRAEDANYFCATSER